jgi:hypothetical protein
MKRRIAVVVALAALVAGVLYTRNLRSPDATAAVPVASAPVPAADAPPGGDGTRGQ